MSAHHRLQLEVFDPGRKYLLEPRKFVDPPSLQAFENLWGRLYAALALKKNPTGSLVVKPQPFKLLTDICLYAFPLRN